MNLSDPLWSHSHGDVSASTNTSLSAVTPPTTIPNLQQRMFTPREESGIFSSVATNATVSSAITSPTANSSFSQSQTDQILSAITRAGGGVHLWTFTTFWYTACTATAVTVLLPLLSSSTFRSIFLFSYNYRHIWHITVFSFVLGSVFVLDVYVPRFYLVLIFAIPQGIFLMVRLMQIRKDMKHRKRWVVYATILGTCLAIDLTPGGPADPHRVHPGGNIGLTTLVPTLSLFFIWIQPNFSLISQDRLITWTERTALWPSPRFSLSRMYDKRPRLTWTLVFMFLEGLNAISAIFLKCAVYIVVTSIPLGLYAVGRVTTQDSLKLRRTSLSTYLFLFNLAISCVLHSLIPLFYIGTVLLFSFLYLYFENVYIIPFLSA